MGISNIMIFVTVIYVIMGTQASSPPYLDTSLSPDQRAKDLVNRLTLEQQVGLLLATDKRSGGVPEYNISDYNWWTECNSGIEVEYPQNVNIGATFNRSVAFLAGRGTGVGLRKRADAEPQDLSCWSPMMNIMRHPLWGRGHEGYGEDPYLAGEMVYQNVLGIQGYGLAGYPQYALANTGCKHFSTFDGPMNWGTAVITDYDWFLNYLPQFERCLDAGSLSVMCSYASLNGVSGCADSRSMQTILRDTWGLKGFVVSDCGAVTGGAAGAETSLKAGTDLECNPWGQGLYPTLINSTRAGNISQSYITQAAERMLYVRFRLGAFDPPASVPFADKAIYGNKTDMGMYEEVSLDAARQSMVLLKNDGILPLARDATTHASPTYNTIAAIGIMDCMTAGYDTGMDSLYNTAPKKVLTDAALRVAFPSSKIQSGPGCRCPYGAGINNEGCETCPGCIWAPSSGIAACTHYDSENVSAALAGADLVVLHIGYGGRPGEQTDLKNLSLYANQSVMLETVLATKLPVIIVLFTNLPVNITNLVPHPGVNAIIQAYYPQHWGGKAVVDVLTGDYNPGGRLIATWPKAYEPAIHGDIGNYTMIGTNKTYRFGFPDPLFPFGYGLSYTSWSYSDLVLSARVVKPCENVTVTVTVHNTGAVAGSEVVQVYAAWTDVMGGDSPTADITMVNFDRVFVEQGDKTTLTLVIDPRHYAVLQQQPRGPATPTEPNGSWVPPVWVMKSATINVFVGGQQPYSTPRLPSNVLSDSFQVAGDNTAASRCPKYIPHDHRAPTLHS
eukprot:m.211563 g.211563  ORF g.211563 m.211563 type:complete len:785 (+) comp33104_c4_seq50:2401-4755(+)